MLGSKREQRVLSGALRRVSRSEALWDHLRCAHSGTTGEDHELPWPNARMSSAARASQMTELASAGYIRDGPGVGTVVHGSSSTGPTIRFPALGRRSGAPTSTAPASTTTSSNARPDGFARRRPENTLAAAMVNVADRGSGP